MAGEGVVELVEEGKPAAVEVGVLPDKGDVPALAQAVADAVQFPWEPGIVPAQFNAANIRDNSRSLVGDRRLQETEPPDQGFRKGLCYELRLDGSSLRFSNSLSSIKAAMFSAMSSMCRSRSGPMRRRPAM